MFCMSAFACSSFISLMRGAERREILCGICAGDMSSLKIMVCGDVLGKIDEVFKRVERLMKKGSHFDMLFAVGEFFTEEMPESWLSYRNGTKKPPIPTYILGPNDPGLVSNYQGEVSDGFELGDNLTYLGKKGIFTTAGGLKVVYLSGIESSDDSGTTKDHCFSEADVKSLVASVTNSGSKDFIGVDILLTSQWPKAVCTYGNAPANDKCLQCGSVLISQLASAIRPRYHFSGLEHCHYERIPYRNHVVLSDAARHTTRFISLAAVGNEEKQKYLYAFTINPMASMERSELVKIPPEATECPYFKKMSQESTGQKSIAQMSVESLVQDNDSSAQYRWKIDKGRSQNYGRKRKYDDNQRQGYKKTERPQDWSCWFCLGGEKVEKHLVASVGNLTYLAMAKGAVVNDHVLICSIAHHPSTLALPDDTAAECEMFKIALSAAMKSVGKHCVFFERNYRTDHMQIQVLPVPISVSSETIKNYFIRLGEKNVDKQGKPSPIVLAEIPKNTELKQIIGADDPFFHVELPDGSRLFHKIKRFFPLQFGREAICAPSILNMQRRVHWRDCILSKEEETRATQKFRDFFTPFDFTLKDDDDET